ncbi:hypothetical protein ASG90_00960 [Nocardioides sp. Soil797]|nr:hypothetical protein ASG90_00960 [Nocardioides sp. Soil797]
MIQWMARHKILTSLAAVLLIGSCGAQLGGGTKDDDSSAKEPPVSQTAEDPTSESPSPTEEAAVPEQTPQEIWAANYDAHDRSYVVAVAAALALKPKLVDARSGSLNACGLLNKELGLDKRVARVQRSFALTSAPTYDQALAVLKATTTTICPEFTALQQTQTTQRTQRLRAEERRRKAVEQRRKKQAAQAAKAQAARDRAAEAQAAEDRASLANVYYANCTDVENAGAAPIYAGDPGYSRDLDRDGDGVACEQ